VIPTQTAHCDTHTKKLRIIDIQLQLHFLVSCCTVYRTIQFIATHFCFLRSHHQVLSTYSTNIITCTTLKYPFSVQLRPQFYSTARVLRLKRKHKQGIKYIKLYIDHNPVLAKWKGRITCAKEYNYIYRVTWSDCRDFSNLSVWNELDYPVDVCSITNGAHIEHL
jgi:hypothetical protein